eukprot:NODE_6660_length_1651_cov_7.754593.p1 GENE.NODE_6660_length_1651_cov_7.754593~~NODE_6660_length_1651_cov_7.754593.p1  ORF type:complete len:489 (-),score=71.70 NODE_6660_length_1651_cov_7.754593:185-1441(-)
MTIESEAFVTLNHNRHPLMALMWSLTKNTWFEYACVLCIILNSILIAVEAEMLMVGTACPPWFDHLALTFLILLLAEFGVRILALGPWLRYGSNTERQWIAFDCFVIVTLALGELAKLLEDMSINMTVLRVLRTCRFLRVLRILRTARILSALRALIASIRGSFVSLACCMTLLGLLMYTMSIVIIQSLVEAKKSGVDSEDELFIRDHFGSISTAIATLFMAITGGIDWGDVFWALCSIDATAALAFMLHILFGFLCMLNVLTGLFVENAMEIFRSDRATMEVSESVKRMRNTRILHDIFREGKNDHNPVVTRANFIRHCSDPAVQSCLSIVGCQIDDTPAEELFDFLDPEQRGCVDLSEFIAGLTNISGPARQSTVARIEYRLQRLLDQHVRNDDSLNIEYASSDGGKCPEYEEQCI